MFDLGIEKILVLVLVALFVPGRSGVGTAVLIVYSSSPSQVDSVRTLPVGPRRRARSGRTRPYFRLLWVIAVSAAAAAVAATVIAVALRAGLGPGRSPMPAPRAAVSAGGSSASPGRLLRIMPLGSSSTDGAGSPATAGFRGPLETLLAGDGIAFDMVGSQHSGPPSVPDLDHEGHGGWTMLRMQPVVAGWVRAQDPDLVLLQVGTNDLLTGATATTTAQRLDLMLATIRAVSSARVIVAGVWAPLPRQTQARADYARLSAAVVTRHRARGESVTFLDTSPLLGRADLFDGLHPNLNGYRKIAAMWAQQIRSSAGTPG